MPAIDVAPADEFPPGSVKLVLVGSVTLGVYNCGGSLYAIEDRCSHDDGPLCEGEWDEETCTVVCPRNPKRANCMSSAISDIGLSPVGLRKTNVSESPRTLARTARAESAR